MDLKHYSDIIELLFNSMPFSYVFWKNKEGVYLGANTNQLHLFGRQPRDFIGKTIYDILDDPIMAKNIDDIDNKIMTDGIPVIVEEPVTTLFEGKKVFLSQKQPIRDQNQQIIGLLGFAIDITARKKMEDELRLAKEQAEAANKAKIDFIHNMQHDLGTPFSGINGSAHIMHMLYADKYPELKEWLEPMMTSCAQWETVHHRILDAIRRQDTLLQIEQFFIYDELHNITNMLSALCHLKKLDLIVQSRDELEPLGLIETDRLKFHLILLSLISNAVNFTEQGYVKVTVSQQQDSFSIDVADTGIGIPADKFDFIFEQFTKLACSNQYASHFKGIGSGLYISRHHAQRLGGMISLTSDVGKGSIFKLTLPRYLRCLPSYRED